MRYGSGFLKKWLAVITILALLFGGLPSIDLQTSYAVDVGDGIDVTNIKYVREHQSFDTVGAYVEITGSGLAGKTVRFEKAGIGGGLQEMGEKIVDEDGFVKFTFTADEAKTLTGVLRIGTTDIDMGLNQFPTIDGISAKNVNVSNYDGAGGASTPQVLSGNNFDQIDGTTVTAEYGRVQTRTIHAADSYVTINNANQITMEEPPVPGDKGYQNIVFSKNTTPSGINTSVQYLYGSVFRFVEDLGLNNLAMFPNTGAKGDQVRFTADNVDETKNYTAYFLKALDGSDEYSDVNKAETVAIDADNNEILIKVPEHVDFELRSYFVVLTNTVSGEVIAEQTVGGGTPEVFTVIGSGFKPTIEQIFPLKGPDTGANVQISGRNLLTLNLPDLTADGNFKNPPDPNPYGADADQTLKVEYNDGTYNGNAVTIVRDIKIQIGKKVFFAKNPDNSFNVIKGVPDSILVTTDTIDDAETDPFKDVIVEITTVLTETAPPNKVYTFSQIVTKQDGYEFIPSTLTPTITEVVPPKLQVETFGASHKLAEDTLLVVKGTNFLVSREVDGGGTITRYPTVLIKKNNDNTFETKYQLGLFPNETSGSVRGIVKYKDDEDAGAETVLMDGANPFQLEVTVVDDNNNVVDGTDGNDVGTKILIRMPNTGQIKDLGSKHVQISNPRRQSDQFGGRAILSDVIDVVTTPDVPVIEKVDPTITTVGGGIEVVVTGSNFQDGLKMYLDGEELTGFKREIAPDGEKILLKFDAPQGRTGVTQLQIVNPDGGLAVADFTYVISFEQDPSIEDFNPKKGTATTLVAIDGDNYLKPDPTAASTSGFDGLRLIGTRVYLDGSDVNSYNVDASNNITFNAYTSPGNEIAIQESGQKAIWSPFIENVHITNQADSKTWWYAMDGNRNPRITDLDSTWYDIRYNDAVPTDYEAFDKDNNKVGDATISFLTDTTTVAIAGGPTFLLKMDNQVLLNKQDKDETLGAHLADYAESLILYDGTVYYTLSYNLAGDIRLSNGRDNLYTITYNSTSSRYEAAKDSGGVQDVTIGTNFIRVGGTYGGAKDGTGVELDFLTPFTFDSGGTREITGHKAKVISKNRITFSVPTLSTGKGFKDLRVINPDTKFAEKTGQDGFFYVTQSSTHPVITKIDPNKGSVVGGFAIDITGSEFEDGMKVFIDGVEVEEDDTFLAVDNSYVTVHVPAYTKDLSADYGIDKLAVSVVILNEDGGSDARPEGFVYVIPISSPTINQVIATEGSAVGGDIVEILGFEFRFFEPYTDKVGGPEYNPGDDFSDLYANGVWDDLLDAGVDPDAVQEIPDNQTPYFTEYLSSPVLPSVYFGENKAKIVEFAKGYMKVITPKHDPGKVDVYVVNNDLGVSNRIEYTYTSSAPTLTTVSPSKGQKQGQEVKDLFGSDLRRDTIKGYHNNVDNAIVDIPDVAARVRFADIDNREIARTLPNSGLIFNGKTTVNLTGGLKVEYDGGLDQVKMSVEENGKIYTRTFTNYDDKEVFLPMEMLQNGAEFYVPNGYDEEDGTAYSGKVYEYIRLEIDDKRLYVERGWAPKVTYDTAQHVQVVTSSYYSIDTVKITYVNPDQGTAQIDFTYTNPDSEPKIFAVLPNKLSADTNHYIIEGGVNAEIGIEIQGLDFRPGLEVRVNDRVISIAELTTKTINNVEYDVIIALVPPGSGSDIDQLYSITVENTDFGLANSATTDDLVSADKKPFYFVHRKPLSGPKINEINPTETSVFGGNQITISGSDFRTGALVLIGSPGGVPVSNLTIENDNTIIKFTTPTGLTVGDKTIQVQNADFGQDSLSGGLKIVSYPTVATEVKDENGANPVTRVSVEGGDKIQLTGTMFQTGAKVVFGGTRTERKDETATGEVGLWKDDKYYIIEGGVVATAVEVTNTTTMVVTVPLFENEGDITVTVINPDGGISDGDVTLEFRVPVPSDPIGLKAEVVDNRYIKLFDYFSEKVEYYEIYYTISSSTATTLEANDYRDFKYIQTTAIEPFKVTRIPGFENLQKGQRIHFVLKAVNKFGPSSWSNIASIEWEILDKIEELGPEDVDGGLDVPEGKTHRVEQDGNKSIVDLASTGLPEKLVITLTEFELDNGQERLINVPPSAVQQVNSIVLIDYGDSKLQFVPTALNTQEFRERNFYEATYGRILTQWMNNSYSSLLQNAIPRGMKSVSKVYNLDVSVINNTGSQQLDQVNGAMDIVMPYSNTSLTFVNESTIALYKYNTATGQWTKMASQLDMANNSVSTRITEPGYYMLLGNR